MATGSSAGARYDHLDMVDETTRSILGKVGVAGLQVATIVGEPAASVCRGRPSTSKWPVNQQSRWDRVTSVKA